MKCKRGMALLLAAVMIITSFPAFSQEAHAAGTSNPSRFVTVEQLKTFDTDDTDGKNPAKVCFGNSNQEWWIVGSQGENSLTLFAASPLATEVKFDTNYNPDDQTTRTKNYNYSWDCTYTGNALVSKVNSNHYGGSALRLRLKGLESSYFSDAEQDLMQETTVYTDDPKNKKVYSTTNKLYLAYGDDADENKMYITVGTNSSENLNGGLRIDKDYWGNSGNIWLRAPNPDFEISVRVARPSFSVYGLPTFSEFSLVPAFELDLSSVIFASAAKAASSGNAKKGTISDGEAMTLRLDGSDKTIGIVMYDEAVGKIAAQKDANAAKPVSLVVQGNDGNKDWYYSVAVEGATVVTKKQIQEACGISGDISFAACEIWLETTIDNVAYARMAEAKNLNEEVTLEPGKTALCADETISNGTDGTVTIDKGYDGTVDVTIKLPEAGSIYIAEEGKITIPNGGKVEIGDGKELTLANGGTVDTDGNVEGGEIKVGETMVTAPVGETVTADKDGNITVPAEGTVQLGGGKELTLPKGGSVDKDETVEAEQIISGEITVTALMEGTVTADKDGNITVPAGGTVETGDGKELILILPKGGSVDKDGNVEAEQIISGEMTVTAPEGGKVTADKDGNITVPAGGTVQTGDEEAVTLPNGGSVDKDGTVSENPAKPTNPPTEAPTEEPTEAPTEKPTEASTEEPTETPTEKPTEAPTEEPPIPQPDETVSPEEVTKNSEKLDSGVSASWKGNTLKVSWKAVQGAEGYDIFAAQCDKRGKNPLVKTVKGKKTSVSLTKIAGKKISAKENYKFQIKAWKKIGGEKVYIGSSKTYHVAGAKNKKYTNAKKLSPTKKKYTLKKGKSVSLKVRIVKESKKKKLLPESYGPALRYFSDNKKVATVTSKGKVTAKGKGTCYIYVTALNGTSVKIKITVK